MTYQQIVQDAQDLLIQGKVEEALDCLGMHASYPGISQFKTDIVYLAGKYKRAKYETEVLGHMQKSEFDSVHDKIKSAVQNILNICSGN